MGRHILTAVALAVILFLVAPLIAIVPLSFSAGTFLSFPLPGLSLRWYETVFQSDQWQLAVANSFIIAGATTLLATTLGTVAALGLTGKRFPGHSVVMALLLSPMIVPVIITAVGTFFFFSTLGLANSLPGLIIAHTVLAIPFVVITVTATLSGYDQSLSRAASSLGANPVIVFRRVTLPIILPGVVSGGLFAFATSFDEVVVALFLAGPDQRTLPRQMFSGVRENISPAMAAVATLLILLSVLLMATMEWLRRRSEKLTKSR